MTDDVAMFRRFAGEPGLVGLGWAGFRTGTWRDGHLYGRLRDDPAAP